MEDTLQKVRQLRDTRAIVANFTRTLAQRERDARQLRATLEDRYRRGGEGQVALGQTAAEKAAKLDADYLAHDAATADCAYQRDITLAAAESLRFEVELEIAQLLAGSRWEGAV